MLMKYTKNTHITILDFLFEGRYMNPYCQTENYFL